MLALQTARQKIQGFEILKSPTLELLKLARNSTPD